MTSSNFCHKYLVGYKCLKVVYFLAAIPRDASGKIFKTKFQQHY